LTEAVVLIEGAETRREEEISPPRRRGAEDDTAKRCIAFDAEARRHGEKKRFHRRDAEAQRKTRQNGALLSTRRWDENAGLLIGMH
jgi:hypothetical protein